MIDLSHLLAEIAYRMGEPATSVACFEIEELESSFLVKWTGMESLRAQAMHWARCVFEADKWQCAEGVGQLYVSTSCDYAVDRLWMRPQS